VNQLNASVRTIFQDLVERRLWPVALVLVIALVAIPVLLSRPASDTAGSSTTPIPPAAPATGSGGSLSAFQPAVNTEGSKSSEIRKSLKGFDSKDPFKVQGLPTGGGTADQSAATGEPGGGAGTATIDPGTGTTLGSESGSGSGSSGSQGTSGSGETTGETTGESGSAKYYTWTATVRFGIGDDADKLDKKRLERFRALPSSENPVVVFMGVTTDGKSAVFLVSAASGTTGEGDCEPDDTCTFLYMKAGDTQSFEAVDANDQVVTYKLRLLDTNVEETEAPASSSSSRRASTRAKRRARRAERIERDRRDEGFSARIEAVGF
jgi:hypothetical protein